MFERILKYRRDLHQIPELDFDLPKTTAYVRSVLEKLPCEVFPPTVTLSALGLMPALMKPLPSAPTWMRSPSVKSPACLFRPDIKGTCTPADMTATWPWCLSLRSMLRRSKTA